MNKPRSIRSAPTLSKNRSPAGAPRAAERQSLYLSRSILVLGGASLCAPLFVSDRFYYPDPFLKSIAFRIAVQAMLLLYCIVAAQARSYRPRFHRISYALTGWFAAMIISSLPGISVGAWGSWWGDFMRMGGVFTQLHLFAYFFVLSQTLKKERDWIVLFTTALFVGVLMGFAGLMQYLNIDYIYRFVPALDNRIRGAAGNPMSYAALMLLDLFIVFWFLIRRDGKVIYPVMAKCWLSLLALLDASLILWEVISPGSVSAGVIHLPVILFAVLVHGAGVCWFFRRNSVLAGRLFLGSLGFYFFFWLFQSQTRGAVFGLAGSLTFIFFVYLFGASGRRTKLFASGVALLLALLLIIIAINRQSSWIQSHPTLSRFTQLSSVSLIDRLLAGNAGLQGFKDHPLLGWGLENYKNAFDLHFPPKVFFNQADPQIWYDRAHNIFVDSVTMTGLLGLMGFLAVYGLAFTFLFRLWRRANDPGMLALGGSLLAYVLQGLAGFDSVHTDGIVFLVLAYVAYLFATQQDHSVGGQVRLPEAPVTWPGWLLIVAAACALPAAFWYLVKEPWESNRALKDAIRVERQFDPQTKNSGAFFRGDIIDLFRKANDYETTGRYRVREEFCNYASELFQSADVPLDQKVRALNFGIALLEESIAQDSRNVRHYLYFSSLVNRACSSLPQLDSGMARSLLAQSSDFIDKAERLSPTRPQVYFEKGHSLALLGRFTDAAAAVEKGMELNPAQKEPHVDLVNLYILAGRYSDAAEEWRRIKALSLPLTDADYTSVLHSYDSMKQFAPMAELYKEQLEKKPSDPELLVHLAAVYKELGNVNLAREMATKAAAVSPKYSSTLQSFLDSLKSK